MNKSNLQILVDYFTKKYNHKNKWDAYRAVGEELGVTSRTVYNHLTGRVFTDALSLNAKRAVRELRQQDLI